MDKLPVGQLPDLQQSNNDDEIMVITNSEYNQLKKEKISDLITDFTSTNENNALTKGTDGKMFVTDFGNASNITEGTLPVSVLPDIPKDKLPDIEITDLPESGVTADTYAYPSSVTVNAQGMVTAIEEGTPSGSNANVDLSNITEAGKEVIRENSGSASGLPLGAIGMAIDVDETKGLQRILNGQVIDVNTNTQGFVNWLKQRMSTRPNLFCTEEEWQAEKAASAYGQVGKFVIDDEAGTVRLPAVVNVQGLLDLQNTGLTVEAGLPNIELSSLGSYGRSAYISAADKGAIMLSAITLGSNASGSSMGESIALDYSLKNSIYGNSDTVQPEAIQYPYFIQIATGQETEVNITNEIELNNPFTLFDSKYSEAPLYNLSWLKSDGEYKPKTTYVTAYEALVVENNTAVSAGESVTLPSGTEYVKRGLSVKLSTAEDITDYDFVINTSDETFRLPLKNGQEGVPDYGAESTIITQNWVQDTPYTAPENGHFQVSTGATGANQVINYVIDGSYTYNNFSTGAGSFLVDMVPVSKGSVLKMNTTLGGVKGLVQFWANVGNGSLYYYVGETVQNANLIDAGRIAENYATKQYATSASFPSDRYIDLTVGASGSTYTAPADGIIVVGGESTGSDGYFNLLGRAGISIQKRISGQGGTGFIPISAGENFSLQYNLYHIAAFLFYYANGSQGGS